MRNLITTPSFVKTPYDIVVRYISNAGWNGTTFRAPVKLGGLKLTKPSFFVNRIDSARNFFGGENNTITAINGILGLSPSRNSLNGYNVAKTGEPVNRTFDTIVDAAFHAGVIGKSAVGLCALFADRPR